ncbi:MAG TPA: GNAT family N-acetyltransferase [Actinomycetota bacterium]
MSSEIQLRVAEQEDLPALTALWRSAFNIPAHVSETIPKRVRVERVTVATDRGRLAASAQVLPLRQWLGGRPVSTAGVASVATQPLMRGTGVGSSVMRRALERARDDGMAFSTLYPATVPVYRRLGYEFAGAHTTYRVALAALPGGPGSRLVDVPEDGGQARASYERLARTENGLTEGIDDDWWPWRVLGKWDSGPVGSAMTTEEVPDGYAAYHQEAVPDDWGYRIVCSHLVAHTRPAALALLSYFRRFKGVGQDLEWHGPPTEPLAVLLPEQSFRLHREFRNMSRILDVPAALESRGYPAGVAGSAAFAVDDPLFPENTGPFLIEADGGRIQVTTQPGGSEAAAPAIGVGALSAMFTGYVTPAVAARVGLVDPDHPALELLARLFAGPPPWTPDFF